jgi:TPR repeat protein
MGNTLATSNLGYCYLYGRDIEPNVSLAIAYFKIAAKQGDVDAAYKLGDIYGSDKWNVKDKEKSIYYYRIAASYAIDDEWDEYNIRYCDELLKYPSLCYALGRELAIGGGMNTDIEQAYLFLEKAEEGYKKELANGSDFYQEVYQKLLVFMHDHQFDEIREKREKEKEEEDDEYEE